MRARKGARGVQLGVGVGTGQAQPRPRVRAAVRRGARANASVGARASARIGVRATANRCLTHFSTPKNVPNRVKYLGKWASDDLIQQGYSFAINFHNVSRHKKNIKPHYSINKLSV